MNNSFADYFRRAKLLLRGERALSDGERDSAVRADIRDFFAASGSLIKKTGKGIASFTKPALRAVSGVTMKLFNPVRASFKKIASAFCSASQRTRNAAALLALLLAVNVFAVAFVFPTSSAKYIRDVPGTFSLKLINRNKPTIVFTSPTIYGFSNNTDSNHKPTKNFDAKDDDHLTYTASTQGGVYEKLNIPIENLVVGEYYRINFTEALNASINSGDTNGVKWNHASTIRSAPFTNTSNNNNGKFNDDIMWSSVSNDNTDGDDYIYFQATAETMYWVFDFTAVNDNQSTTFEITAPGVEHIDINTDEPYMDIGTANTSGSANGVECFNSVTNAGADFLDFNVYRNNNNCHTVVDLKNLTPGQYYKLTFDETVVGSERNAGQTITLAPTAGIHGGAVVSPDFSIASGVFNGTEILWTSESLDNTGACIYFMATDETMKWVMDYSALPAKQTNVVLDNVEITALANPHDTPYICYPGANITAGSVSSTANFDKISAITSVSYYPNIGIDVELSSNTNSEQLVIPIKGLTPGVSYQFSFTTDSEGGIDTPLACAVYDTVPAPGVLQTTNEIWADKANDATGTLSFVADAETMYWVWDLGGITNRTDSKANEFYLNITNGDITEVGTVNKPSPCIDYPNATVSNFTVTNTRSYSPLSTILYVDESGALTSLDEYNGMVFSGKTGTAKERIVIPITGLTKDSIYTLDFSDSVLVAGAANTNPIACTVQSEIPSSTSPITEQLCLWSNVTNTDKQISFLADSDTMYWIWDLSQTKDSSEITFDLRADENNLTSVATTPAGNTTYVDIPHMSILNSKNTTSAYNYYTADIGALGYTGIDYGIYTSDKDKVSIPLKNLEVGSVYKISFDHDYTVGGSTPTNKVACTVQADTTTPITAQNAWISGTTASAPVYFDEDAIYFVATDTTMNWVWDYTQIANGVQLLVSLQNIEISKCDLTPTAPYADLPNLKIVNSNTTSADYTKYTGKIGEVDYADAKFGIYTVSSTASTEKAIIPLKGLEKGYIYTIEFDNNVTYKNADSSAAVACAVQLSDTAPAKELTANSGVWISTASQDKNSIQFLAEAETMYWVWDYHNVSLSGTTQSADQAVVSLSVTDFTKGEKAPDTTYVDFPHIQFANVNNTNAYYTYHTANIDTLGYNGIDYGIYTQGNDKVTIPINNLDKGSVYKLTFTHDCTVDGTAPASTVKYACTVQADASKVPSNCQNLWISGTSTEDAVYFVASDETMNWIWDYTQIANGKQLLVDLDVVKLEKLDVTKPSPYADLPNLAISNANATAANYAQYTGNVGALSYQDAHFGIYTKDKDTVTIPIYDLVPGTIYQLSFNHNMSVNGAAPTQKVGSTVQESASVLPYNAQNPWLSTTGNDAGEIYFVATAETMNWIWDYTQIANSAQLFVDLTDVSITPYTLTRPTPCIDYPNASVKQFAANNSAYSSVATMKFVDAGGSTAKPNYDGMVYTGTTTTSNKENIVIPITGLEKGAIYTLDFDYDALIGGAANTKAIACTVQSAVPANTNPITSQTCLWASNLNTKKQISFIADSDTMYWVWDLSQTTDSKAAEITIRTDSDGLGLTKIEPAKTGTYVDLPHINVTASATNSTYTYYTADIDTLAYDAIKYGIYTGGTDRVTIPVKGLEVGSIYKISFDHSMTIAANAASTGTAPAQRVANAVYETAPTASPIRTPSFWISGASEENAVYFVATAEDMYWVWDYAATDNSKQLCVNLSNVAIAKTGETVPTGAYADLANIGFVNGTPTPATYATYQGNANDISYSGITYGITTASGVEKTSIPLRNLESGHVYQLNFKQSASINGVEQASGIGSTVQASTITGSTNLSGYKDNMWTNTSVDGDTSLYFYASANTMYWNFDYGNITDGKQVVVDLSDVSLVDKGTAPSGIYADFPHTGFSNFSDSAKSFANITAITDVTYDAMTAQLYANSTVGSREKLNIPLKGLEGGKFYKLTYDLAFSTDKALQTNTSYQIAAAVKTTAETGTGALTANPSVLDSVGNGIWVCDATGTSYSGTASVYFYVPAGTTDMSWIMDFGKLGNSSQTKVTINNVNIEEATDTTAPGFMKDTANFGASFGNLTPGVSGDSTYVTFSGTSSNTSGKWIRVPISGLVPGEKYTVNFDFSINSNTTINSAAAICCGIGTSSKIVTDSATGTILTLDEINANAGLLSAPLVRKVTTSVTTAATSDTVYLIFNIGNDLKNGTTYSISLNNLTFKRGALSDFNSKDPTSPSKLGARPPVPADPEPTPSKPADPAAGDPAEPAAGDPAEPTPGAPAEPAPSDPAEPASGDPAEPAPSDPAEPASGDPAEPASGDPSEPPAETPAQNPPESAPEPEPTPAPEA